MELTGRLTRDAEVKTTKDGRKLVAFSIVLNDRYKTKEGEKKDEATFFNCSYWLSMDIAKHLKKGMIITLFGKVGLNAYQTRDGEYHAHLTFHANNIKIIVGAKSTAQPVMIETGAPVVDDLPF